jgi:hypothetical protein
VIAAGPLAAQEPIAVETPGAPVRLSAADRAALESTEMRKTLPCTVTPAKPELGFELRFHAGYEAGVPFKELAGDGDQLTTIFRVIPEGRPADAVYFAQRVPVPSLDDMDRGSASLTGAFDVGKGKYHIDWLMRDRSERICSFHWDAEAALAPHDRPIDLDIAAGAVRPFDTEPFQPAPPVARDGGNSPLHVKVIVNFAPQYAAAAALQPVEIGALVSILRTIGRDPHIARFSVVAFNLQEQKVLYRQQAAPEIDFPALGRALRSLNLGTTDLQRLAQKHEGSEFLAGLIATEVGGANDSPDAVVFTGPKLRVEDAIPAAALKQLNGVKFPVFYMSYNLNPAANPWRDTIGIAVKYLKGMEFSISRPRDVFFAWSEIAGRIGKAKTGATVAGNAPSQ